VYTLVGKYFPQTYKSSWDRCWANPGRGFIYYFWQQGVAFLSFDGMRFTLNNPPITEATWEELERRLYEKALLEAV